MAMVQGSMNQVAAMWLARGTPTSKNHVLAVGVSTTDPYYLWLVAPRDVGSDESDGEPRGP